MGKKRTMVLIAGLVMSSAVAGAAATTMTACSKKPQKVIEDVTGIYYGEANGGGCEIDLRGEDKTFTFIVGNTERSGEYSFDGTNLTLNFTGDLQSVTASMSKTDAGTFVINISYAGADYNLTPATKSTVTFKDGSSVISSKDIINGTYITEPAAPQKSGYAFAGWYESTSYLTKFDFSGKRISGNTDVYARFIKVDASKPVYNVTFVTDSGVATPAATTTINGKLYNLPTPTKAGATFAGWWVSDYKDGAKLTYKYEEQELKSDTTLFAVWETGAPLASITSTGIKWTAKGTANTYTVEITTPSGVKQPAASVGNNYLNYTFNEAGEYVVTVSLNGKGMTLHYNNKGLARVSQIKAEGNTLSFAGVENAEKYLITVECGDENHTHTDVDLGTNTTYDFSSCAMKADGIKFVVKAVAEGYVTSESDPFVLVRNLTKVSNINIDKDTDTLKWDSVENATQYVVTIINGDVTDEIKVAAADLSKGVSLGKYTGDIQISVYPVGFGYNSPEATTDSYTKYRLAVPQGLSNDGYKLTWSAVANAKGYIIKVGDKVLGETQSTEYTLTAADFTDDVADVSVSAKGEHDYENSLFCTVLSINKHIFSAAPAYEKGKLSWQPVIDAVGYEVRVNEGNPVAVESGTEAEAALDKKGDNTVGVRCKYEDGSYSDWNNTTVTGYELSFFDGVTAEATKKYVSSDIEVELTEPSKVGYTFIGWYDVAQDGSSGKKLESGNMYSADTNIYAHYNNNTYKVEVNGVAYDVVYDKPFSLPVPTPEDATCTFGGWYIGAGGTSTQYTDVDGYSKINWNLTNEKTTLYAKWVQVFEFTLSQNGKEYSVSVKKDLISIPTVSKVKIPAMYNGLPVTTIESGAFNNCDWLEEVDIPDTIQVVAVGSNGGSRTGSAFSYCDNIKAVNIYAAGASEADRLYSSSDGVLIFNNPRSSQVEIAYYPYAKTGSFTVPETVTHIPSNSFRYSKVEEVIIGSSVHTIGQRAFGNCSNLKKVTFADAETASTSLAIGFNAFFNCSSLKDVELPTRLASIELNTFDHCDILESINVAGTSGAFKSDDGVLLKKDANNDYSVFFCPRARTKEYVIGVGITSIARRAFQGCENLVTMNIPEWVSSIGEEAFMDCTALANLTFENARAGSGDVLEIGDSAFYGCFALNQLSLPEQLTKLGKYAFGDIAGLDEVTLNTTYGEVDYSSSAFASYDNDTYVTTLNLGMYVPAFDISGVFGSTALEEITVAPGNANIAAQDGVLYDKDFTTILFFPNGKANLSGDGTFVIPETVTTISANVFNGKKFLKSITIGNNVSTIGNYAFANCENLEEIIFNNDDGAAELEIGTGAFSDCYKISELNLPTRLRVIGDEAFAHLPLLEEVNIPEGVTTIGKGAFLIYVQKTRSVDSEGVVKYTVQQGTYKTSLKSFHIPSTVVSIGTINEIDISTGMWAYYGNNSNTRFFSGNIDLFYSKAENLGGAVNPCYMLEEFTVAAGNANYASLNGVLCKKTDGNITEILLAPQSGATGTFEVPATVTKIADQAFYNSKFTAITFAEGSQLQSVGANAFGAGYVVGNDTGKINSNAVEGTSNIASVTLPEAGVTTLFATFAGNTSLTSVNVPYTVETLGSMTFKNCSQLTGITFSPNETGETDKPLLIEAFDDRFNIFEGAGITALTIPERVKIGEYAFTNMTSLISVTIPESVKEIGRNAFTGCTSLATVTFAGNSQLKTIGDCAFGGAKYNPVLGQISTSTSVKACTSLTTINLPSSLESIGVAAFYNNKFTDIEIPAGVKTIGREAFKTTNTGNTTVTFVEGSQLESIDTAAFYGRKGNIVGLQNCTNLTSIGDSAFYNNNSALTAITIPASVKTIGTNAFYGCSALSNLTFATTDGTHSALESVGATCFQGTGITSISFPANSSGKLIEFGNYIFGSSNSKLSEVSFGGPVVSLEKVLNGAWNLLTVNAENEVLKVQNQMVMNADGTCIYCAFDVEELVDANGVLTIPDGVTRIGPNVFEWFEYGVIKKVILPVSLVEIGDSAFAGCEKLVEVVIPDGSNLKTIGNSAFKETALTSFDFTKTTKLETLDTSVFNSTGLNQAIVLPDSLKNLGGYAFYGTKITSVKIPAGLLTVGDSSFRNCTKLTTVELPQGLEILGPNMFYGCTKLEEVSIPDSIKLIGENAFRGCTSLTKATVNYSSLINADTGIVVGDSKTLYNGSYMFCGCTSLANVTMGENPRYIGSNMFESAAFESIDLSNIISMGATPLQNCKQLTSVTLSDSLTVLPSYMFWNCTALENVTIPESVTVVEQNAFDGCSSLKELVLPNVESIAQNAFKGCTSLTYVDMYNVKTIGNTAFNGCTALEEVVLGSVTEIGENVFNGKALIKSLDLMTVKTLGKNALNGCEGLEILDLSNATEIGEGALQNCTNLATVDLSSVRSIGKNAFNGCAMLEEVELPVATTLGDGAFAGCINLVSAEITKVKTIGAGAFQGCEKLAEVNVEKVKSIGANAFAGCGEITSINTSKVESFGDSAFEGCYKLTEIDLSGCDSFGARAFYGCAELAKVILPKSLPSFGSDAFTGCEKISFVVPEGANYSVDNENGVIADENGRLFLLFGDSEGELVLNGVREIGGGALGASKASKIVFTSDLEVMAGGALGGFAGEIDLSAANKLTVYGDNIFKDYAGTEVVVPDFVTSIAGTAFTNCTNLETVTLGTGITEIPAGLFNGLSNVVVEINGTLTSVGASAFYNNKKLTSIDLSEVTSIGASAFEGCSNLTSVTLCDDLTELANQVFWNAGLQSIEFPANLTTIGTRALQNNPLTSITFPDKLEVIGSMAFNGCKSLTDTQIVIPASVKTIEASAFSVTNITGVTFNEGLESIGESAFSTNSLSGTIYIPTTLTSLGFSAFSGTAITGVNFPERTNGKTLMFPKIDNKNYAFNCVFYNCEQLESITLPNYLGCAGASVEKGVIPQFMFCNNSALKTVIIGEGVTNIDNQAFAYCSNLTSVKLPSTIIKINNGFAYCTALTSVVLPASLGEGSASVSKNSFAYCSALEKVFAEFTEADLANLTTNWYTDSVKATIFTNATVYWNGEWEYVDGVPTPKA